MIVDPAWYLRSSGDEVGAWWVRRWAYDFFAKLASEQSFEDWERITAEAREDLRAKLVQQAANTSTMACVWFVVDLAETVNCAPELRNRALQYLIRLALTMDEAEAWAGIGKNVHEALRYKFVSEYIYDFAMGGESARRQRGFPSPPTALEGPVDHSKSSTVPGGVPIHGMTKLGKLPQVWILVAQGREQFDVLRNLYRLIHKRAQQAVIWAIRDSSDFAEWREAMAYQMVARSSQHFVPVTPSGRTIRDAFTDGRAHGSHQIMLGVRGVKGESRSIYDLVQHELGHVAADFGTGVWSGGTERSLFDSDELEGLRKGEAYTNEQFAHLVVAINSGWHEEYRIGFLRETTREAIEEWDRDPFSIRRELRAKRSRYGIPPFLALELDDYLKNQGKRPRE